jgi:hypothetical protein
MLRLLKPVLRVWGCCCLANAVAVFRTLLLILPSEPYIMRFFFLSCDGCCYGFGFNIVVDAYRG